MINRELIRLKVVQLSYAYYQNGTHKLDTAEKDLFTSLSKAYDLYLYLLELMVEITRIAERAYLTAVQRAERLGEKTRPNTRFVNNQFIAQLRVNHQLEDFTENQKKTWANDEDFVRRLFKQVQESEAYQEWMAQEGQTTYEEDREFWRRLYKEVLVDNEDLDQLLEEKSIFWNDDRFIVDTFVMKTIRRFERKNGANQQLLPEFRDEEDREFARRLFRASMLGADSYRQLIAQSLRNWDLERLALMDLLVMQTALAEMMTFPNIPLTVTINEYVDISKYYSTPRSGGYINGMLDAIARRLIEEGRLKKELPEARSAAKAAQAAQAEETEETEEPKE
ncbi:MAG: transcription antitermination factor NusB [Bacteroidaceae bacterium]|nr:transcription antitermination factor NusB [Bacteroidaceae bacterium]